MEENNPIMVGCNYHTTWQSHRAMRFVLTRVYPDGRCELSTMTTGKVFLASTKDLVFIQTKHNRRKMLNLKQKSDEQV